MPLAQENTNINTELMSMLLPQYQLTIVAIKNVVSVVNACVCVLLTCLCGNFEV